jgi:tripartite-type tricarboxylate transporter receptor subunit TctC
MGEAGLPGFAATGYVGIMTTGGTPREIISKLNAAINEVMREPEFSAHFTALGYEMTGGTPEEFATFIRQDTARYARVIQAIGGAIE